MAFLSNPSRTGRSQRLLSAALGLAAVAFWTANHASAANRAIPQTAAPESLKPFLDSHCLDCHQGKNAEGGLDLQALSQNLDSSAAEHRWIRILDRVQSGEMPPQDAVAPPASEREAFVRTGGEWIRQVQRARTRETGRVHARRLTRKQFERTVQTVLGIDIPLEHLITAEPDQTEFSTVAAHQQMSHFHLDRYLDAIDTALTEAFDRALSPDVKHEVTFKPEQIARDPKLKLRNRSPEMREGRAIVWNSGLIYYGRVPCTTVQESGWYRIRFQVGALKPPESGSVWGTVSSGRCVSNDPLLSWIGYFEAFPEPRILEYEAYLTERSMLEIRPADRELKRGKFSGGQVGDGEGEDQNLAGIALDWITMERIHKGPDNAGLRKLLFDNLLVEKEDGRFRFSSPQPEADLRRLVQEFAERAFRRPISESEVAPYVSLTLAEYQKSKRFGSALQTGYRAILCSPRFLYFTEQPGELDDFAIANRLSYMLTGNAPDSQLMSMASAGTLHRPENLRAQTDRLLAGESGRTFIRDFADEWLDLDQMDVNEPEPRVFLEYDQVIQKCMIDETICYLEDMLQNDLSVSHLIDSDFTYLNSRLARYYRIPGVTGDAMQRVPLKPEYNRGGLLTHGSVLRVTSNMSVTSPVLRGVWVCERLLGIPIPPPPSNVPAIEPDVRGAKTMRQMLELHRSNAECASCHSKIDPPGFALENYDSAGQWRDYYDNLVDGKRKQGAKVHAADQLADGRKFRDIREFRSVVSADLNKLAENVAEKLVVYGTGAPISYVDRDEIQRIAHQTAGQDYGFRSVLHAVVTSPLFLSK
ncbi:DUF1592 domain-containing protein [Planctomicrobium sp. SH664]|uniref:DUF1592 domain-containing protein n=1 Tax=Planctomicrobium sp. SH664 TaxID=3448125 RepID=UPI003F5C4E95